MAKQAYDPRRAAAGQTFTGVAPDGSEFTVKADGDGVVRPRNDAEQRLVDSFGLAVARKEKQAEAQGSGKEE